MPKKMQSTVLTLTLLVISALLYLIQQLVFHRLDDTGFYFLQDLAFVPISVLMVTLGVNTVMVRRERSAKIEKVSVVVNEFYAEAGTDLIRTFSTFMVNLDEAAPQLRLAAAWQDQDFSLAVAFVSRYAFKADLRRGDLAALHRQLAGAKEQILRLFENANLIEHDRFTDVLWAVYHVFDELRSRPSLTSLPDVDRLHLESDIQRAYQLLLSEWVESMRSLKTRYPYLYAMAVRKCPFSCAGDGTHAAFAHGSEADGSEAGNTHAGGFEGRVQENK